MGAWSEHRHILRLGTRSLLHVPPVPPPTAPSHHQHIHDVCGAAGLAAITAGCSVVEPWAAIICGGVAAVLCYYSDMLLDKLEIDDPAGVGHGAGVHVARMRSLPPPTVLCCDIVMSGRDTWLGGMHSIINWLQCAAKALGMLWWRQNMCDNEPVHDI